MKAATAPVQRPRDARLLVVDARGGISHRPRRALAEALAPGDVVVANDAATWPASLVGTHLATGEAIEVRLAGRASLAADDVAQALRALLESELAQSRNGAALADAS